MPTFKYKTNINCGGCIATVTPFLQELGSDVKWEVDTKDPEKILTVKTSLESERIENAVKAAGFTIERKKGILGLF